MVLATIGWLIGLAAMIWVIYDVFVNHKGMSMGKKVLWTIFAILFSIITAIVYYFIVYKNFAMRGNDGGKLIIIFQALLPSFLIL